MARTFDKRKLARARKLIDGGMSRREAAKRAGISEDTIRRYLGRADGQPDRPSSKGSIPASREDGTPQAGSGGAPPLRERPPDPPPKSRPARRQPGQRPTDEELEDALRKILKVVAIPVAIRCEFCGDYMRHRAPIVAAQAIGDEDIRELIVWGYSQWERYQGAAVLVSFFAVPAMHHFLPDPLYRPVAPFVGLPPRLVSQNGHQHRSAPREATDAPPTAPDQATAPEPEPQPDTGLEGLDMSQLVAMAAGLGVDVPVEVTQALADGSLPGDFAPFAAPADTVPGDASPEDAEILADAGIPPAEGADSAPTASPPPAAASPNPNPEPEQPAA